MGKFPEVEVWSWTLLSCKPVYILSKTPVSIITTVELIALKDIIMSWYRELNCKVICSYCIKWSYFRYITCRRYSVVWGIPLAIVDTNTTLAERYRNSFVRVQSICILWMLSAQSFEFMEDFWSLWIMNALSDWSVFLYKVWDDCPSKVIIMREEVVNLIWCNMARIRY